MESLDEEDDLKLVKASATLLSDLETALPKLLWKPSQTASAHGRVHTQVKRRDLDYILKLIEPFQGEPQLLDSKLKYILPPISEAYIGSVQQRTAPPLKEHLDFQSAICTILYTLCKVRGYKVVLGLLNNETRYLESILVRVEDTLTAGRDNEAVWQVPYVLLLWLSHLLLTPFDLATISDRPALEDDFSQRLHLPNGLPPIAQRVLAVGFKYLPVPTKAQDAAAMLLVRLAERPDLQKLHLADAIVSRAQSSLQGQTSDLPKTIYEQLGPLRFLAGISRSSELRHMIPSIYGMCIQLSEDEESAITSNAVGKKLLVKIHRNSVVMSLRSASNQGPLLDFLETSSVVEEGIDYLLRSLADRDTPVRYGAAKALSLVILELERDMGHEVIQAVLDTFKEDMPRNGQAMDFRAVNPLKWHGLTLALAHILFKRSASTSQLPDIINALVSALQFEQRTATGSSVGTNVRDAANFGIWSLSRRYTTEELLSVRTSGIGGIDSTNSKHSVIQYLAIQLLLAACLDPAGNIRRGSSAALQELIGRHPDQVYAGIALVQIVDYQAVGLRRRAMADVANRAAELNPSYWTALLGAMFEWRGLGSSDVPSREGAAIALARLGGSDIECSHDVLLHVMRRFRHCSPGDAEILHGLVLAFALLLKDTSSGTWKGHTTNGEHMPIQILDVRKIMDILLEATKDFSLRILRSDLPSAIVQFLAALCRTLTTSAVDQHSGCTLPLDAIDLLTERVLARQEDAVQQVVPPFVHALLALKRKRQEPLGCIGAQTLCQRIVVDASKSSLYGASRAIALGALIPLYGDGLTGDEVLTSMNTLGNLTSAMNVDWRVTGVKALQLSIQYSVGDERLDSEIAGTIVQAVHRAMNDYTIDERGDVGSLVRLQAVLCASQILASSAFLERGELLELLEADIRRLSLEKLDRIRVAAAQCQFEQLGFPMIPTDIASVSSREYFKQNLRQLEEDVPAWKHTALLMGCISCAGISAEPLLQASRLALLQQLDAISTEQLQSLLSTYSSILKSLLLGTQNTHPALELLAFLFDMQIPQRIAETNFKWRNLLSTVQKSHHKSNDIPRILAALQVYGGLADIASIRVEVLKKLVSMLKTNPYPKVRLSVAEQLFVITREPGLKERDWTKPASQHLDVIKQLESRYVQG